jgi:hypothetical protein
MGVQPPLFPAGATGRLASRMGRISLIRRNVGRSGTQKTISRAAPSPMGPVTRAVRLRKSVCVVCGRHRIHTPGQDPPPLHRVSARVCECICACYIWSVSRPDLKITRCRGGWHRRRQNVKDDVLPMASSYPIPPYSRASARTSLSRPSFSCCCLPARPEQVCRWLSVKLLPRRLGPLPRADRVRRCSPRSSHRDRATPAPPRTAGSRERGGGVLPARQPCPTRQLVFGGQCVPFPRASRPLKWWDVGRTPRGQCAAVIVVCELRSISGYLQTAGPRELRYSTFWCECACEQLCVGVPDTKCE